MKRKVLSTLLAATMLTGLLAGCGNSQEPAASNNEPAATTPAADKIRKSTRLNSSHIH